MAQQNSASAKQSGSGEEPVTGGSNEITPARRRAAAYLDLWERQLRHVAANGAVAVRAKTPEDRSP
jgi:hypothetical protein